jgi:DNA-binding NtrC family response regulator
MKKILVVDDQKEIRDILSKFLFLFDYEIDSAEDAPAAMKLLTEKQYDLLIADFLMSAKDSLHLIKRLKGRHPSMSILIMSGSAVGEAFFKEAGANAFLTKPLDLSSMRILIEKILNSS